MAFRPPVNCGYPACNATAVAGSRYCEKHQLPSKEEEKGAEKNRKYSEPWRAWYHRAAWRKLRALVLVEEPICKRCHRNPSTVADHIKPHKGDWLLFILRSNVQGLCKPCHDLKTATEDGGFGNAPPDNNAPVPTGEEGKQYSSSAVGEDAINRALEEDD